jgi:AraC-like DNA-binding protein
MGKISSNALFWIDFRRAIQHLPDMSEADDTPSYISRQVQESRLFFLDAGEEEGFAVRCGGFERCRPDYRIDRPGFDWFCLEFVSRGEGRLELDGVAHDLRPGVFYLYGPGIPHRIASSAEHPLGKYFVGFQGDGVEEFLERHAIRAGMVARCPKAEPIRRGFDMLIDRGVRKSRLAAPICSLIARELLLLCRDDAAEPVNTGSPAFATYVRAREFIEGSFLNLNSLEAVSKGCGVDAPYLCRLFARYHDGSPYQYLTRLRMDHASRLLLDENATVGGVAMAMGFKDAFHFSRVFKSVHHVPPSRFRKLMHPPPQG